MHQDYAGLSYEETVRKYARTVASAALMRLGSYDDAEDCFQNTFLKLYTSSPSFTDEAHLRAWLIRVAINEAKNILRIRCRTVPLEAAADIPVFLSDDSSEDRVPAVLMQIKPKYREVLYLHYCERYKIDEIARILGRNPNTVKTLLRRGKEQFKTIYKGGDTDEAT